MRAVVAAISGLALAACTSEASQTVEQTPEGPRPYPSESGVIVYQTTGLAAGDETITWDDWGMRSVTVTNTTATRNGETVTLRTRTITTPDALFMYSSETQGYLRVNIGSNSVYNGEPRELQHQIFVDAGADTVAGLECQSHRGRNPDMQLEVCMAGDLPLRVTTHMNQKIATRIDLNANVDPSIFEPDGQMIMEMSGDRLRGTTDENGVSQPH